MLYVNKDVLVHFQILGEVRNILHTFLKLIQIFFLISIKQEKVGMAIQDVIDVNKTIFLFSSSNSIGLITLPSLSDR